MSNLYAQRVSSEHPLSIWPLDDGASFVSLITEAQRDLTTWTAAGATLAAGLINLELPFKDSTVSQVSVYPASGVTGAGETVILTSPPLFTEDDIYSSVPIAASVYVWLTAPNVASIDIGSSLTPGNYTTNVIPTDVYNGWVKVQTSSLKSVDGRVVIRINLNAGVSRSNLVFQTNGIAVGQYLEAYSSSTLGVSIDKMGPYIKGVGVDITKTDSVADYPAVTADIADAGANTITVPIKIAMAATTSDTVSIDADSLDMARTIYANYSASKKIIIEPYPWINGGASDPDVMDPTTPADWFAAWQEALKVIVDIMPNAWGIYVGTNMELIEDETASWIALMNVIGQRFAGKIMYKTKWWITNGDATTKEQLGLWAGVDIIAVSAYFELLSAGTPAAQSTLESAIRSTTEAARAQDVYAEVIAIGNYWNKPILIGDLACPSSKDGAHHPWDVAIGGGDDIYIQHLLLAAYQAVFEAGDRYIGFSVPFAGTTGEYALEDTAESYLSALTTAPVSNSKSEFALASGDLPAYYVASKKRLTAASTGIPMAFGSNSYARLIPTGTIERPEPSFVFDGAGAFNMSGRYQDYTIEFWLRVNGSCTNHRRIFGPVESEDGLYINESTITLVIGDNRASANLGVLFNPMLMHIRLHDNRADLIVNGDVILVVDVDYETVSWSDESNKMLGLYSPSGLGPIDVDCISLFTYIVPEVVAKRRFAWGQAVGPIEIHNSRHEGQTVQASFPASRASKSMSYPDNFSWESGIYENLSVSSDRVTIPDRPLPELVLSGDSKNISIGNAALTDTGDLIEYNSHGLFNGDVVYFTNIVTTTGLTSGDSYYVINATQTTFQVALIKGGSNVIALTTNGSADVTQISSTKTYSSSEFYSDLAILQNPETFFRMAPNSDWDSQTPYFHFGLISDFIDLPRLFTVTWDTASVAAGTETIMTIRSKQDSGIYIRVYRDGSDQKVESVHGGTTTLLETVPILIDIRYTTAFSFTDGSYASTTLPDPVRSFVQSIGDVEILVGGDENSTFAGNIYRMSFMNDSTKVGALSLLSNYPTQTIDYEALSADDRDLLDKVSYSVYLQSSYGKYFPEIQQRGYWEDYIPLSQLAGFVNDINGNRAASIDLIQFNIGHPRPHALDGGSPIYAMFNSIYGVSGLTYGDFSYINPGLLYGNIVTYLSFEAVYDLVGGDYDALYAAYSTLSYYEFLAYAFTGTQYLPYVTEDMEVRSYISFQSQDGNLKRVSDLSGALKPSNLDVVYTDGWSLDTDDKIEVVDGTVIVPPRSKRLDKYVLSIHLEFVSKGTVTRPVSVKSLEITSIAQSRNSFTDIGTQSGKPAYPFAYNSIYYDHNVVNPYRVDKRSLPYLHLGRATGFEPAGITSTLIERGIAIPISERLNNSTYRIGWLQFWMRVDDGFSTTPKKIYELKDGDTKISLMMTRVSGDSSRASITAEDEDGNPYLGVTFFQNGASVPVPTVSKKEWVSLALYLDEPLALDSSVPYIKIYPGATYNNISYFPPDPLLHSDLITRVWSKVDDDIWTYWTLGSSFPGGVSSWYGVLFPGTLSATKSTLPAKLYDQYVGNSAREVISSTGITASQGPIDGYLNIQSVTYSQIPA